MALNNPFAGGPDFVAAMRNALDGIPNTYVRPPPSGGEQISIRFPESRMALVKALEQHCQQAGWNRSQIINALFERGLFELFNLLRDNTVETIMNDVVAETAPTVYRYAGVADQLRGFNRFRLYPSIQKETTNSPNRELEVVWHDLQFDQQTGTIALSGEQWVLQLHVRHLNEVIPDTVRDARDSFKNAILHLNVAVVLKGTTFRLTPLRPTYLDRKKV